MADECPGLADCYGEEFKTLYTKYETEGKGRKTIEAADYGIVLLNRKLKLEPHICVIKMLVIKNLINKIWEQSNLAIYVPKL